MFVWLMLAAVLGGGAALLLWRRRTPGRARRADRRFEYYPAPEPAPPPPPPHRNPRMSRSVASPDRASACASRPSRPASCRRACGHGSTSSSPRSPATSKPTGWYSFRYRDVQLGQRAGARLAGRGQPVQRRARRRSRISPPFSPIRPAPGERIAAIAPMKSLSIRNSIVVERANIQMVELGGSQVYVPVVAFNVHYRGTGGDAQTSASYLGRPRHRRRQARPVPAGSGRADHRPWRPSASDRALGDKPRGRCCCSCARRAPPRRRGTAATLRQARAAASRSACRQGPSAGRARPCTARSPAGNTSARPSANSR